MAATAYSRTGKVSRTRRVKVPPVSPEEADALVNGKPPPQLLQITPPRMKRVSVPIIGIAPYMQNAFSQKSQALMEATQRAGSQAKSKRVRKPRDFEESYENAKHISEQGWLGIPASAFRNAAIAACRLVGYKMTHAKMSLFVDADGQDRNDGTPLVRIEGKAVIDKRFARNENGSADLRWRPRWDRWSATVNLSFDLDQFSAADVGNLMMRAGLQVGIGEGRPDSPKSNGLGWGRFVVKGMATDEELADLGLNQ